MRVCTRCACFHGFNPYCPCSCHEGHEEEAAMFYAESEPDLEDLIKGADEEGDDYFAAAKDGD